MKQIIRGKLSLTTMKNCYRYCLHSARKLKYFYRLFALQDDIGTDILQVYNEKKRLIDIPQSSQFLTTANSSINATTLHKGVSQWLNLTFWPAWDVSFYRIKQYVLNCYVRLQYRVFISAQW